MTGEEIPQELIDMLDGLAGKKHGREGRVVAALARILTRYDELKEMDNGQARRYKGSEDSGHKVDAGNLWPLDW